jgi:hypothetical protein
MKTYDETMGCRPRVETIEIHDHARALRYEHLLQKNDPRRSRSIGWGQCGNVRQAL